MLRAACLDWLQGRIVQWLGCCMRPQESSASIKQLLLAAICGGMDDKIGVPGPVKLADLLPHVLQLSLEIIVQGAVYILHLRLEDLLCTCRMGLNLVLQLL